MRLTPHQSVLRNWRLWAAAIVAAELGWFALLHPLVPRSLRTVFVLALLPLALIGYIYLVGAVAVHLADRGWNPRLRQMIALILAISVGCFIFALLWITEAHFSKDFG
jgi:hypothetical protein